MLYSQLAVEKLFTPGQIEVLRETFQYGMSEYLEASHDPRYDYLQDYIEDYLSIKIKELLPDVSFQDADIKYLIRELLSLLHLKPTNHETN